MNVHHSSRLSLLRAIEVLVKSPWSDYSKLSCPASWWENISPSPGPRANAYLDRAETEQKSSRFPKPILYPLGIDPSLNAVLWVPQCHIKLQIQNRQIPQVVLGKCHQLNQYWTWKPDRQMNKLFPTSLRLSTSLSGCLWSILGSDSWAQPSNISQIGNPTLF